MPLKIKRLYIQYIWFSCEGTEKTSKQAKAQHKSKFTFKPGNWPYNFWPSTFFQHIPIHRLWLWGKRRQEHYVFHLELYIIKAVYSVNLIINIGIWIKPFLHCNLCLHVTFMQNFLYLLLIRSSCHKCIRF